MNNEGKSCSLLGYNIKTILQTMKPLLIIFLPHDIYMPKIYIIGGILFIVIKYMHICEPYYNFYFIFLNLMKNTLDNHI